MTENTLSADFRCGYIAIVGRPNVGKSTLMNKLIGAKVSITSRKAQTTRHRITGIQTVGDAQFIYVDTPGFQTRHSNALNKTLNRTVTTSLTAADVVLFVVEAGMFGDADAQVMELLPADVPAILVINKSDKLKDKLKTAAIVLAAVDGAKVQLAAGVTADLYRADVTDSAEVDGMFMGIERMLGSVDIVVVNATPAQPQKAIEEYDWAFYQQMLDFFVKSPFLITRRVLPHMKKQRWGRIVNVLNTAAKAPAPSTTPTCVSRAAGLALTKVLSLENAPHGVRVNAVCPGAIHTGKRKLEDMNAMFSDRVPMGRVGLAEEVARGVAARETVERDEARARFAG